MPNIDYGDNTIDVSGESDQSLATSQFVISVDFDIEGYECGLRTESLDYIDDDGDHSLDLNWSGEGDCGDVLFVQTSWYYETHRERFHEKTNGRQCHSKSQVDGTTEVGVTIRVDDEDAEPVVDRVFDSVGWYETGTVRCHITGKPGQPEPYCQAQAQTRPARAEQAQQARRTPIAPPRLPAEVRGLNLAADLPSTP